MKKYLPAIFLFVFYFQNSLAQNPGEWVWLRGDMVSNNPGNFGIQGVSNPANEPPSLYESCEWTDQNGNFWLFGGLQTGAVYNDLWKYNPVINEWIWMKGPGVQNDLGYYGVQGVPSILNCPPSRSYGMNSWVASDGNLWMFGGADFSSGVYCDLWKYEINSNEWTWMKGPNDTIDQGVYGIKGVPDPANYPASRSETAASWTDNSGNLWLFGGDSYPFSGLSSYNDLWKYTISNNCWTWMTGSSNLNQPSVYGVKGIEATSNTPGARWPYAKWKDKTGNFWLWGGCRWWNTQQQLQGDLWRFNPVTTKWAWMDGDTIGPGFTNGTVCNAQPANDPCFPEECRATWMDVNGNFLGYIYGFGIRNSLWMYCPATANWSMLKADSLASFSGLWGIKGVSSPVNIPPQLSGSIGWTKDNIHFYMFGGCGGIGGQFFNALWMYTIDPCCNACHPAIPVENFTSTDTSICPGSCIDISNLSQSYSSYSWIFPGGNPPNSNVSDPQNICYATPGIYDITLIAHGCNVSDTLTFQNYITVYPAPLPQAITQNGDTLSANAGATSYQWYFNGNIIIGATDYFYIAPSSGDYNVVATDFNGCEVEAAIFNVLAGVHYEVPGLKFEVYPNPAGESVVIHSEFGETAVEISIYNTIGEEILAACLSTVYCLLPTELDVHSLAPGIYFLRLKAGDAFFQYKLVKL